MAVAVNPSTSDSTPRYRRGDVVVVPFPFSGGQTVDAAGNRTASKRRPALVLAHWHIAGVGHDYLCCLITSRAVADPRALPIAPTDLTGGTLSAPQSFVRPAYLFAADEGLIVRRIGVLSPALTNAAGQIVATLVAPSPPSPLPVPLPTS